MISPRRTFVSALTGCIVIGWAGNVNCQAPPANLDAATAVSNTTALPPPAPLPDLPGLPAQGSPAPAGLPALPPPPDAAGQLPGLPAAVPAPAPAEGLPVLPANPAPAAGVNLPNLLPASPMPEMMPTIPADAAPLPSETTVFIPDSTPATHAPEAIANPLMPNQSTAIAVPATMPRYEVMSLQRHPLPAVTPSSPIIPAASLAETINQKRQKTTLPGSGGDTNYAYATLDDPTGPAKPLITPPSIIDTKVGLDIGKDYPPLQAVMAPPRSTPTRWDEAESAFGIPTEAQSLNYYVSRHLHKNPEASAIQPYPSMADVIVLRGGQEFQGIILERGATWRIELTNGTIITVPGNKVTHVRKQLAAPTQAILDGRTQYPR